MLRQCGLGVGFMLLWSGAQALEVRQDQGVPGGGFNTIETPEFVLSPPPEADPGLGQAGAYLRITGEVAGPVVPDDSYGFEPTSSTGTSSGAYRSVQGSSAGYGYQVQAAADPRYLGAKAISETPRGFYPEDPARSSRATALLQGWDWVVVTGGNGTGVARLRTDWVGDLDGVVSASYRVSVATAGGEGACTVGSFGCEAGPLSRILIDEHHASDETYGGYRPDEYFSVPFEFTYDQPFRIFSELSLESRNGGLANFADYGNRIEWRTLILPNGSAYRTASGLAFAEPVPEPESYALFLAGLALLADAVRRRNQSS